MKIILKIVAFPVALLLSVLCLLCDLLYSLGAFVVSLPLVFMIGCCIYCIATAMWSSLAILVGLLVLCLTVLVCVMCFTVLLESLRDRLNGILWS